ncbi:hypothetical protein COY07_03405 [Candidatus Peregrinibacteria bacterium CG_4_10_14_0_2_um_filter_43_11]|nr:MAG: hypothetical protein COY07_03405 [Candidatus Peregrinibacteria bacterium CG_4_10_14_0_2_um_filter_43_11]
MELLFIGINGYPLLGILWNLILVFVAYFLTQKIAEWLKKRSWKKLSSLDRFVFSVAFLMWFFWFPNIAYLFTENRHLLGQCEDYDYLHVCPSEAWMLIVFFAYSLIGVPVFIYVLQKMTGILKQLFNKNLRHFPLVMIPLTALGMLIGLIDRLNTWDIIHHPFSVIQTGLSYFSDANRFLNFIVFTGALYLIYYGAIFCVNRVMGEKWE